LAAAEIMASEASEGKTLSMSTFLVATLSQTAWVSTYNGVDMDALQVRPHPTHPLRHALFFLQKPI